MYFGELAEKSLDFQNGHLVGGRRMAEHLIRMAEKEFEGAENKKQIVEFLKTEASKWTCHCTTYGMGEGEEIYFDGKNIPLYTDFPDDNDTILTIKKKLNIV